MLGFTVVNAVVAGNGYFLSFFFFKNQQLERYHVHTFFRNVAFDMATGHA